MYSCLMGLASFHDGQESSGGTFIYFCIRQPSTLNPSSRPILGWTLPEIAPRLIGVESPAPAPLAGVVVKVSLP